MPTRLCPLPSRLLLTLPFWISICRDAMDLSLPRMDGWEATRRLKSDDRTSHIPVVALTAHDGAGELERATHAGCDWFVPKPCPPAALIAEVRRVLSSSER